jgi:hypothetical protein
MDISLIHRGREDQWWQTISQIESISDTSDDGLLIKHLLDIPNLANVAIGIINQTNPGVARGIESVLSIESSEGRRKRGVYQKKGAILGRVTLIAGC